MGFGYGDLDQMMQRYDPAKLTHGWNRVDGEEIFFVANPGLGFWAHASFERAVLAISGLVSEQHEERQVDMGTGISWKIFGGRGRPVRASGEGAVAGVRAGRAGTALK